MFPQIVLGLPPPRTDLRKVGKLRHFSILQESPGEEAKVKRILHGKQVEKGQTTQKHRSKREANMCAKEEDAEKRRKTALA